MDTLNSVLDLSRIEADKLEIKFLEVNLNIFIDENIKLFQSIGAKRIICNS